MTITNHFIDIETESGISIHNLTPYIKDLLEANPVKNGYVLVFARHTTTALFINEYEERLLDDIKVYLEKLAPPDAKYLHNDLHLRVVPPDEPINGHSHLMAITLNNSEYIPIVEENLALGTWQSVMLIDLDGPRKRNLLIQICGE
ncbi:secondary thiamine-phosphate synthase enzyme YjbQ [Laspinema palackyanum]|uniref:secondary thiamine-phosphate synthase enzyme YjbQ n=1 Tax=Laspinema palackyanum TaxID=3231601 RepID=UPI00345DD82A|nr:secondary thiamine-phosphate synthase enzyme YjbQ [Laspinema sp. D2c]